MANITLVGAGNSGCAHAYVLSSLGHKVTLFKTSTSLHDENFNELIRNNGIFCINNTIGGKEIKEFQFINQITRNIEEAFTDAEIVIILTQSIQHEEISKKILPYIQHIKGLLIVPGNLGSVFFRPHLSPDILIAEGESTIIDARIEEPGIVRILFKNVRNAISFNPSSSSKLGFKLFSRLIPNYTHLRTNIIESALNNPNLIVHTVGSIMSAARIEKSNGEFWMYKEGFTPSVWNIVESLDEEKKKVIKAYGGKAENYLDCCKFRNEESLDVDSWEVFKNYSLNGSPKGPSSIHNRYIYEDVPNGLCLLSSLGKKADIPTPTADALTHIAMLLTNTNLYNNARTTNKLGWENYGIDEIINLIN